MQKNQVFFIGSLIFAIIVTIFALTNAGPVSVNLLIYEFKASQAIVIFISAMVGALIVIFLSLWKQIEFKKKIRNLQRRNEELLKNIDDITNVQNSIIEEEVIAVSLK
ncbi:LapA family protein [Clostridium gasigenes]|uniref:LapA family protein n=1 Tax=Clostridium gasigenes TaxID=94869 RepID=UPI001C0CB27E|nr:LapA family protein [Clostridium gasigenes]MBU3108903.1 LapA family protein [Clostridium gasigenes]